jgi:hypothetical protein
MLYLHAWRMTHVRTPCLHAVEVDPPLKVMRLLRMAQVLRVVRITPRLETVIPLDYGIMMVSSALRQLGASSQGGSKPPAQRLGRARCRALHSAADVGMGALRKLVPH